MGVTVKATVQHGFSQEEIAEAVKATLSSLWGFTQPHPAIFESDIGMSFSSVGERFTIDITEEGTIKTISKTLLPTAVTDGGKNRRNIIDFLNALKQTLSTSGLAASKPEAYSSFISGENTYIGSPPPTGKAFLSVLLASVVMFCLLIFLFIGVVCLVALLVVLTSIYNT